MQEAESVKKDPMNESHGIICIGRDLLKVSVSVTSLSCGLCKKNLKYFLR